MHQLIRGIHVADLDISTCHSDLLELPFFGELLVKLLQLFHQLLACGHHCLFWADFAICLHSQFEDREEGVWYLVSCEEDVWVLGQMRAKQIAEGVVFFVEGEEGCVRNACANDVSTKAAHIIRG
jgi:hypothetical protein